MLSLQYLRYKLNIPVQFVIILTDSLFTMENSNTSINIASNVASNRSELKQLSILQDVNTLQLKKARQNFLPSLTFFAIYTQLYQGPQFNYSNNFYWAPISYLGIKLAIPITGSIKNSNSVNECKYEISQTDFNLKQKKADIDYEIQEGTTQLLNAEKNLYVAKDNYYFSQRVYELNKQQFNLGSFSYEKLLNAEKTFTLTEHDYITAVYELLMAKINYQKATGN